MPKTTRVIDTWWEEYQKNSVQDTKHAFYAGFYQFYALVTGETDLEALRNLLAQVREESFEFAKLIREKKRDHQKKCS